MFIDGSGAIVSGGTSGLGAAAAAHLAAAGAEVVVGGRNAQAGAAVVSAIGSGARFVPLDVTDERSVAGAVADAASAPRGLRIAISAAGSAIVAKTVGRDGAHPLDSFESTLRTNLLGSFNLLRLAAEAMTANEPDDEGSRGVIVLTSSIGAYDGQMGQVAYAAAKGGIVSMVLPAARDLARAGIRVVGIAPGVFDTPFMDVLSDEAKRAVSAAVPFPPRLGRADEYASLVLEVVRNTMLNGETIRLDGALRLSAR
jgi:NAD(P)-dependent dehydrogenase (short-subunit alcohol dehydrogenase family)